MTDPFADVREEVIAGENRLGGGIDVEPVRMLLDAADELLAGMERIIEWSKAYPIDIFPEPDFKKAAEVLKDNGMTLDAISASNMRHVITEVGKIAEAALPEDR